MDLYSRQLRLYSDDQPFTCPPLLCETGMADVTFILSSALCL